MAYAELEDSFRPALLVIDMQEDFCPPVSGFLPTIAKSVQYPHNLQSMAP